MPAILENESHSLEQLGKIRDMYSQPQLAPREALFLATQMVNHGFAEAEGVLAALKRDIRNDAAQAYLARLGLRHRAIQSLPHLKTVFADQAAMEQLYASEGYLFRRGATRPATAVVIFTSMYNNFHFSNAVLDAALAAMGVSRLFLKDTSKHVYLRGVAGLSDDLRDLPAALLRLLAAEGVTEYIITGYSSGGYPSFYAAQRMNPIGYAGYSVYLDISDRAKVPRPNIYKSIRQDLPAGLFLNLTDRLDEFEMPFPSFVYCAAGYPLDVAHAGLLRGRNGCHVREVEGATHTVTSYLLEEGEFLRSFENLLGAS